MRLTHTQIQIIRQATQQSWGADVSVWLFGSSLDDARRGCDVDLYIEQTQKHTLISALRCKVAIEDGLDLQVDLVVKEPGKDKAIYHLAKTQGSGYDRAVAPHCTPADAFATDERIYGPFKRTHSTHSTHNELEWPQFRAA